MRRLVWIGTSRRDYLTFPDGLKAMMGFALYQIQIGQRPLSAKPLKGFKGVTELAERFAGDAYRVVYTVRFEGVVYVLHAFQKKSRTGIETPRHEIDLIRRRLREAEIIHVTLGNQESGHE